MKSNAEEINSGENTRHKKTSSKKEIFDKYTKFINMKIRSKYSHKNKSRGSSYMTLDITGVCKVKIGHLRPCQETIKSNGFKVVLHNKKHRIFIATKGMDIDSFKQVLPKYTSSFRHEYIDKDTKKYVEETVNCMEPESLIVKREEKDIEKPAVLLHVMRIRREMVPRSKKPLNLIIFNCAGDSLDDLIKTIRENRPKDK